MYFLKRKNTSVKRRFLIQDGAGDGNRTRVTTLGRSGSTIEPRLHTSIILQTSIDPAKVPAGIHDSVVFRSISDIVCHLQ